MRPHLFLPNINVASNNKKVFTSGLVNGRIQFGVQKRLK